MGFLDLGIKKPRGSRTASARASLAALKRRRRLRYFSQIDRLPPVFGFVLRLVLRAALILYEEILKSPSRDI